MSKTIILAGVQYEVKPMPLGRLRTIIPAFNRVGHSFFEGRLDEAAMSDIVTIIAGALGVSTDEAEAIPATMPELIEAVDAIAEVSGLKPPPEDSAAGEAVRAVASIGTNFTPGS